MCEWERDVRGHTQCLLNADRDVALRRWDPSEPTGISVVLSSSGKRQAFWVNYTFPPEFSDYFILSLVLLNIILCLQLITQVGFFTGLIFKHKIPRFQYFKYNFLSIEVDMFFLFLKGRYYKWTFCT